MQEALRYARRTPRGRASRRSFFLRVALVPATEGITGWIELAPKSATAIGEHSDKGVIPGSRLRPAESDADLNHRLLPADPRGATEAAHHRGLSMR